MDSLETCNAPNEVFQQDATTEVPTIVVEVPVETPLRRNDIDSTIISEDEVIQLEGVNNEEEEEGCRL